MSVSFKIKRLTDDAIMPEKAHASDAGFDLFVPKDVQLTHIPQIVKLGFSMSLPPGYEGQIRPRSSSALRGMQVQFGTIDCGYRGEIGVVAWSFYPSLIVEAGTKIAQMVISELAPVHIELVADLPASERGENGFGSTG